MLNVVSNERDRAFIALLWETGARIGELLDLQIGDLEDSTGMIYVIVVDVFVELGLYVTDCFLD